MENCSNTEINNLTINKRAVALEIAYSSDINIRDCQLEENVYGIFLLS